MTTDYGFGTAVCPRCGNKVPIRNIEVLRAMVRLDTAPLCDGCRSGRHKLRVRQQKYGRDGGGG